MLLLWEKFDGNPAEDKVAVFIYIGEKASLPMERTRPNFEDVVALL